ncbi:hypothetical protein LTR54_014860 [Friedmanniomyces endolithicus]|nr:hypothetical protein LTR54_014860 [Friedmanniomyces endolithicus]
MYHNRRQRARAAFSSPISPGSTAQSTPTSVARSDGGMGEDFWRPRGEEGYFPNATIGSSDVLRHDTGGSEQSQEAGNTGSTPQDESSNASPGSSDSMLNDRDWRAVPDVGTLRETWRGHRMVERQSKHEEPPRSDTHSHEPAGIGKPNAAPETSKDDCTPHDSVEEAQSTEQAPGFWGTLLDSLARAVDAMSVLSPETVAQDDAGSITIKGPFLAAPDEDGGLAGIFTRAIDDMIIASPGGFLLGEVDKERCVSPLALESRVTAGNEADENDGRKTEAGTIVPAGCESNVGKIYTQVYDTSQTSTTEPGPPVLVSIEQDDWTLVSRTSSADDFESRDALSLQGGTTDEEGDDDADASPASFDLRDTSISVEPARVCIDSERENVGLGVAKLSPTRSAEFDYCIMPARLPTEPDPHNFLVLPSLLNFLQPLQIPSCHHDMRADPFPPFPPRDEMPPEDFQLSFKPTHPSVRGADQDLMAHLEESYHATGLLIGLRPDRGPPLSQRLRKVLWHLDDDRKSKLITAAKNLGLWSLHDQLRAFDAADEVYREEFQRQLRRRTWHGRDRNRDATPRPSSRRVSAGEYLVEARSELQAQLLLRAQRRRRRESNPYYQERSKPYPGEGSTRIRQSIEAWSEDASASPEHSAAEPLPSRPVPEQSQNGTDCQASDPNGEVIRRMNALIREAIGVVPGRSASATPPPDTALFEPVHSTNVIAADTSVQNDTEAQQFIATDASTILEPFDFMFEPDTPMEQSAAQPEESSVPGIPQSELQPHDEILEAKTTADQPPDILPQDFQLFDSMFETDADMQEAFPRDQMQSEHGIPHPEEDLHDEIFGPDEPRSPAGAADQTASTSLIPQPISQPHGESGTNMHAEAASEAHPIASAHDITQPAGIPSDAVSVMTSSSTSSQRSRHKRLGALDFTLDTSDSSWRLGRTHSRASVGMSDFQAVLNWTNQEASASPEREELPMETRQFVGSPPKALPPTSKPRRVNKSIEDFSGDATSPSPTDGRGRRRSNTVDNDPGPSPTDRRGRRRSSMIESLPSSTLKPPADENLKPDPRLTHFDADQTSPTEDDLEIIRHAAALARGRGQTNAEEVRGSYGTGA